MSTSLSMLPAALSYSQPNGEAEHAVQTVKRLLKKEGDRNLAVLSYRTTPL